MTAQPTLTTERLTLRPCVPADAEAIQALVSDVEIARNTLNIPHPYPAGAASEWITRHTEKFEKNEEIVFAIVTRGGELVGIIGLVPKQHDVAEIGYWIGVPYWNRGYATEAAVAIIRYGFEELGLHRIFASHFSRNPASGRVLQKAGMQHEGTQRGHFKKWGEYLDAELYAVLNPHAAPAPPASR